MSRRRDTALTMHRPHDEHECDYCEATARWEVYRGGRRIKNHLFCCDAHKDAAIEEV